MKKLLLSAIATAALAVTAGVILAHSNGPAGDYVSQVSGGGGTISGSLTVNGAGSTDCVVFDDNGAQGCTRTADEAPNNVVVTAQSVWPGATVNTTPANLVLGAGQGRTAITAFTFANCATDTVTLTVDGTSTVRTEGTHWTAAGSDAATCASLLTALEALSGVSADSTCSGEELRLVKSLTTASISLAVSDATCATVTNGTDGIVRVYSGPGTAPGIATVLELGEQGSATGTNLMTNGPNGNELYITTGTTRTMTSVNLARLLIRPSTATYGAMGNLGIDISGNSGGLLRGGSSFVIGWNSASDLGSGASDVGLARNAAGVLRVTDGSTGYGQITAIGALTAATMTASTTTQLRTATHRYTWTNAMVTALGAALTGDISVATLPAKYKVVDALLVVDTACTIAGTLVASVGRTGAAYDDYLVDSDIEAAANTVYGNTVGERGTNLTGYDVPSWTGTTDVVAHLESTGANLDTVTTCTGSVYLTTELMP